MRSALVIASFARLAAHALGKATVSGVKSLSSQKKGGWLALRTQTEFDCLAIEADQEMTACYRLAKTCG